MVQNGSPDQNPVGDEYQCFQLSIQQFGENKMELAIYINSYDGFKL